jgi:ribosomal protein S27AE
MKTDWNTKLIDNYPLSFKNNPDWIYKNIECNGGWLTLVERLLDSIESHLATLPKNSKVRKNFVVQQIKEKFGGLRVYVDGADDFIYDKIMQTEEDSKRICEFCGIGGEMSRHGHYYRTVCGDCRKTKGYELVEMDPEIKESLGTINILYAKTLKRLADSEREEHK